MRDATVKRTPIHEVELKTAHSVRQVRGCHYCHGSGMDNAMISTGNWQHPNNAKFHPQCYIAHAGFRMATKLPLSERNKFRIKDLTIRQHRRLLELSSQADIAANGSTRRFASAVATAATTPTAASSRITTRSDAAIEAICSARDRGTDDGDRRQYGDCTGLGFDES